MTSASIDSQIAIVPLVTCRYINTQNLTTPWIHDDACQITRLLLRRPREIRNNCPLGVSLIQALHSVGKRLKIDRTLLHLVGCSCREASLRIETTNVCDCAERQSSLYRPTSVELTQDPSGPQETVSHVGPLDDPGRCIDPGGVKAANTSSKAD